MFSFIVNDILIGFWSNSIGEVFYDGTVRTMGWNDTDVTLINFPISQPDLENKYRLEGDSIRFYSEQPITEEVDGEIKETGEVEEVTIKLVQGTTFVKNGIRLHSC